MEDFWSRVLYLLHKKEKTQVQLANYIGRPKSTITTWIHTKKIPPTDMGTKIAEYLGVTTKYLISGEEGDELSPIRRKLIKFMNESSDEDLEKLWATLEAMRKMYS